MVISRDKNNSFAKIITSANLIEWWQVQQVSLVVTSNQSSRLIALSVNTEGQITGCERVFEQARGLYATPERIYLGCQSQLWQLDNVLKPGQLYDSCDRLFIPRIGYTTGDLNLQDVAIEAQNQRVVFVSSLLNCLATVSDRHSCIPLWKPSFISHLVNEDRCHLSGLAIVDGKARYVTAYSQSDVFNGWWHHRQSGGCIIDILSDTIIATGLSLPHSPRFYQGKLWLLNAGTGEFGYIDANHGTFEAITFCPGWLRGLAFIGDYAIVGSSQPPGQIIADLKLAEKLTSNTPECGLLIINIKTGEILHWLKLSAEITDIFDVQILSGVNHPQVAEIGSEEIHRLISLDPLSPLVNTHTHNNSQVTVDVLYQQALDLQQQGKLALAISQYEQIITVYPEYAPAWYQIGVILGNQQQTEQAILAYQKTLSINPHHAEAYNNLGILRVAQQDFAGAISCFQAAINSNPDYAFAHNNLGLVWQMQGNLTAAVGKFREALQKNIEYAEAYLNLGIVLEAQQQKGEAVACFRAAIRYKPNYIKAYNRLGTALISLPDTSNAEIAEARKVFEQVLALQPDSAEAFTHLSHLKALICDWQSSESDLNRLWQITQAELKTGEPTSVGAFDTIYKPWDRHLQLQVAKTHSQSLIKQLQQTKQTLNFTHSRSHNGRLKIGYISNDFRNHATSHLMRSLFSLHDRTNYEIFAYSSGADDQSDYRHHIINSCEHFQDISQLSVEDSAKLIFHDQIDILVDLNGYTAGSRTGIFTLKPAPIQVNYLGYPGTMGADFMDYIITDSTLTPPEFADSFSEKFVVLPHSYQVNDYQQEISSQPMTRAEHGLPASGFVFCCFNNNYKIEPVMFDIWMSILASVPGSVIWLFSRFPIVEDNLKAAAQARGVSGERLIFAQYQPKAQHLARLQLADLFLDTLYCNAHTTASDALWAGVPLITYPGQTFASRVAASLLNAVGLPELITPSLEAYAQLAINLANSPANLHQLKQKLAQNRLTYPLFDTPLYVRHLEQAYRAMWDIYSSGQAPQAIEIL
ncbi:TIGR03032 family protein [Nostoc sp. TCL26-01]|uniref:TIGR03032 family protein n=1 Tax=Nostoc sp. TCL26-01 TaxID=2576904 RepID=UPI0015BE4B32|nr:TIGR03032 family protein [Nostoc sp. TCL26-01]QLE54208.1 TIGR03032 family protein [Nostoc sp. TCL26-01]